MLWAKADSAAVVAGVRVRIPIIVRDSGNAAAPSPDSAAHSHGALRGAASRPAYETAYMATSSTISGRWLRIRAAQAGITMDVGMDRAAMNATSSPARCADRPASRYSCAYQPKAT